MAGNTERIRETWLDTVYARPLIGVTLEPLFRFPSEVGPLFSPWIDGQVRENKVVEYTLDVNSLRVAVDGIATLVTATDITTEYLDATSIEQRAGRPTLKFGTEQPIPYSAMCGLLIDRGHKSVEIAYGSRPRSVVRFGVVANCNLERSALPPGVEALVAHAAAPWQAAPMVCNLYVCVPLGDDRIGEWQDRCHHAVQLDVEKDVVTLKLDWQREFVAATKFGARDFRVLATRCVGDAMLYFEKFGAGELEFQS